MPTTAAALDQTTIDAEEVARFSAIADEWWDMHGKFAPLHKLNPVRIGYLREQIIRHFAGTSTVDGQSATPFNNLSLVDIGCGGGLISEPMARLGAMVTGVDASETNIRVASLHAKAGDLGINYQATTAEAMAAAGKQFDVVLALEIIEHVSDVGLFYDAITALVKPGGLLIMSTLNRTPKSYALGIIAAEYIFRWLPRGTHTWRKFIRPSEMAKSLAARKFAATDVTGITFSPIGWDFSLNPKDLDVNYLLTAKHIS